MKLGNIFLSIDEKQRAERLALDRGNESSGLSKNSAKDFVRSSLSAEAWRLGTAVGRAENESGSIIIIAITTITAVTVLLIASIVLHR